MMVLSECWHSNKEQYNIPGYRMFCNNARINKNDGVIIFIKSEINVKITDIKLPKSNVSLTLLNFEIDQITFGVSCLYRPPSTHVPSFLEDIEAYFLNDLVSSHIDIFIGDININIHNQQDNLVNSYLSILNHFGFLSAINGATRVTNNSSSCIDHIFIRRKLKIQSLKFRPLVLNSAFTYHYPIMLDIAKENFRRVTVPTYTTHTVFKTDYDKLKTLIQSEDFLSVRWHVKSFMIYFLTF